MNKILFLLPLWLLISCSENNDSWYLKSPDSSLGAKIYLHADGQMYYTLSHKTKGKTNDIILPSPLGIIREDESFAECRVTNVTEKGLSEEDYTLVTGKRKENKARYHSILLELENQEGARLNIEFRAYDEGIAFRYVFPDTSATTYTVIRELTAFTMPDGNAWLQPYDTISAYSPAYERNYEGPIVTGTPAPGPEGWCFPALFEVNNSWLLITESNLQRNFFGSHLKQTENPNTFAVVPPEAHEAFGFGTAAAHSTLPWEMPWRVIMVGDTPGKILESNLVTHLAAPSVLDDESWIVPGRASWGWWSGYLDQTTDTPEKLKDFIDLAHEMSWEYSLIDAGWHARHGVDIEELATYAKERNVKLLLWYNSGGPINRVNAGPRDRMYDRVIRRKEMQWMQELGISGIKVDFFSSDKQDFIKLYLDILEDAADFRLTVNFHGSTVPRGWHRTYPHMITLESVKGSEGYIYHADFETYGPTHTAILPFTRNVVGPMDYTPVALSTSYVPHRTSFSYEIALAVVFESGIQHFADKADVFRKLPENVKSLLRDLPAAWDDTKYLSGYPGHDLVVARKYENQWFVGGINAENRNKSVAVSFSFLDPDQNYQAVIITDGETNSTFNTKTAQINARDEMTIEMLEVGGFSMMISPVNDTN